MAEPVTGTRVALPADARPPFSVYVNGDQQTEGSDFVVADGAVRFTRPLSAARRPEGVGRKLVMATIGIGFYPKGDTVDVHYTGADGKPGVASGLTVEPDA
jgi:hypothetical protein